MHGATAGATPFRINLHVGDVGHTVVFGPTGAGKSVPALHHRPPGAALSGRNDLRLRQGPEHVGNGQRLRGRHYDVAGDGGRTGLLPPRHPSRPKPTLPGQRTGSRRASSCRPGGHQYRASAKRSIGRCVLLREANDRTLTHFVAQVQDETIRSALRYYTLEGTLGRLLDAEEDGLTEARFIVFEIEDLMAMGERNVIPVLLYLFRRFERALKGQPAYLLLDEAWVMLGHPVFRAKIREWLKVLRKANCAVILATQSLSDAARSGILDVLIESCPTKIFLPNEEATTAGTL